MCDDWTSSRSSPTESLSGSSLTISFPHKHFHETLYHEGKLGPLAGWYWKYIQPQCYFQRTVFFNLQRCYLTQCLTGWQGVWEGSCSKVLKGSGGRFTWKIKPILRAISSLFHILTNCCLCVHSHTVIAIPPVTPERRRPTETGMADIILSSKVGMRDVCKLPQGCREYVALSVHSDVEREGWDEAHRLIYPLLALLNQRGQQG